MERSGLLGAKQEAMFGFHASPWQSSNLGEEVTESLSSWAPRRPLLCSCFPRWASVMVARANVMFRIHLLHHPERVQLSASMKERERRSNDK